MLQATTDHGLMILTARDDISELDAHSRAVARPKTTLVTAGP